MRIYLATLLIATATHVLRGQHWSFEFWHDGKIVLESGDTLKGKVKYDMNQDLLQFTLNRRSVVAYTPRKAMYFEIFDEKMHEYRQFYSLPVANASGYKVPAFFELLAEGKMTLLAREALEYRSYTNPLYFYNETRLVIVYRYFFLEENGNIESFDGKKEDLLEKMGRRADVVERYMREHRLNVEDRREFARIVSYYNSLFQS